MKQMVRTKTRPIVQTKRLACSPEREQEELNNFLRTFDKPVLDIKINVHEKWTKIEVLYEEEIADEA